MNITTENHRGFAQSYRSINCSRYPLSSPWWSSVVLFCERVNLISLFRLLLLSSQHPDELNEIHFELLEGDSAAILLVKPQAWKVSEIRS